MLTKGDMIDEPAEERHSGVETGGSDGSMNRSSRAPKGRHNGATQKRQENNRPGRRPNAIIALTCVTKVSDKNE